MFQLPVDLNNAEKNEFCQVRERRFFTLPAPTSRAGGRQKLS
jgi:hypothetical protein